MHEQNGAGLREDRRVRQIGDIAPRAGTSGERVVARVRGRGKVVAEEQLRRRMDLVAAEGERAAVECERAVVHGVHLHGQRRRIVAAVRRVRHLQRRLQGRLRHGIVGQGHIGIGAIELGRPLARVGAQAGVQIGKLVRGRLGLEVLVHVRAHLEALGRNNRAAGVVCCPAAAGGGGRQPPTHGLRLAHWPDGRLARPRLRRRR